MKFGSLFSGIGGFDLGFENSLLEGVWQVERDKDCNRVLSRHWPNVQRFDDVTTVGKLEPVELICGGFPCQDLSVAGKRAGLAGERSGLWFEFLRIVESNLPRFVVIENVPGLLSSDEGRDFAAILRGMVNVGYCLAWRVFDAQYFGVAQRRRRVFIVGSLGSGSCAEILFESESVPWNPPTRREARAGVAATIRGGSNGGSAHGKPNGSGEREMIVAATLDQRGRGPTDSVMMNLQVSPAISSKWAKGTGGPSGDECQNLVTHALRSEGADASEDGTGRGTPLIAAPLTANYGKQLDNSDRNGGPPNIVNCFNGYTGGPDDNDAHERTRVDGRNLEAQEELAYAVTNPGSGGRTHSRQIAGGFGVRRLTPRECERLQGFPDDWTLYDAEGKQISDSARYRMLGNAVAVPCAKWIGKRILEQHTS